MLLAEVWPPPPPQLELQDAEDIDGLDFDVCPQWESTDKDESYRRKLYFRLKKLADERRRVTTILVFTPANFARTDRWREAVSQLPAAIGMVV